MYLAHSLGQGTKARTRIRVCDCVCVCVRIHKYQVLLAFLRTEYHTRLHTHTRLVP
jgi:hypothetical protein